MNFTFSLLSFLAIFFVVKARHLDLKLTVIKPVQNKNIGEIIVTLFNKDNTHDVIFEDQKIMKYNQLSASTDFDKEIDAIQITWFADNEDDAPLFYSSLRIVDGNKNIDFDLGASIIEDGETIRFLRKK